MQTLVLDHIASLSKSLLRARRFLGAESPYGPAWAATVELVAALEADARSMGMDPDEIRSPARPARPAFDGSIFEIVARGRVA